MAWARDVRDEEVGRNVVEDLVHDLQQDVFDRLRDDRLQSVGDRPPVLVQVLVGAVLCREIQSQFGKR